MSKRFNKCVKHILKYEGATYTNDPDDPGGPTKYGITLGRYREQFPDATAGDIRRLRRVDALPFYKRDYWDACKCDKLPIGIDFVVFNRGVNSGPKRSVMALQKLVGVKRDGIIGPKTIAAVNDVDDMLSLALEYQWDYARYYRRLQHFWKFGKGWLSRNDQVTECVYYDLMEVTR